MNISSPHYENNSIIYQFKPSLAMGNSVITKDTINFKGNN